MRRIDHRCELRERECAVNISVSRHCQAVRDRNMYHLGALTTAVKQGCCTIERTSIARVEAFKNDNDDTKI